MELTFNSLIREDSILGIPKKEQKKYNQSLAKEENSKEEEMRRINKKVLGQALIWK